jgi:hypothetical protein
MNLYFIAFLFALVFLISYKPGSGTLQKWFGVKEGMHHEMMEAPEVMVPAYKVTSRDEINARELDNIFGIQR